MIQNILIIAVTIFAVIASIGVLVFIIAMIRDLFF